MAKDEKPGCFDGVNIFSPSGRYKMTPPQNPALPKGWSTEVGYCDPETFAKWAAECDGRPKKP